MKYQAEIIAIGEFADALLKRSGSLIIFNECAPPEIAEISVLHTTESFSEDVKVGDTLELGNQTYTVTCVGSEAMHTLRELGHCTLKFEGESTVQLPGQMQLSGPANPVLNVGDMIVFK
ncbi:MAG: PTS glucitol/sorbitol transporter subunit IIA [Clostridiaceae bacterium]